ncbi:helix-turn-helix domain-containing protein [Sphingomonas guangdongensis]|nr:helix-turn-helix domain-containing protein [Sphingomonas guangdongensis]
MLIDRTQIAEPWAVRVDDACRLTGLGRTTIYELMRSGRLRSVKVGRARLIDRASLRTLIGG